MGIEHLDMPVEAGCKNPVVAPEVSRVSIGKLAEKLSVGVQNEYSLTHFNTLRLRFHKCGVTGLQEAYDGHA